MNSQYCGVPTTTYNPRNYVILVTFVAISFVCDEGGVTGALEVLSDVLDCFVAGPENKNVWEISIGSSDAEFDGVVD